MIRINNVKDLYDNIVNAVNHQQRASFYAFNEKTVVLDGTTAKANYKYCEEHNLDVYYLGTAGGVTVLQKGNINVAFIDIFGENTKKMYNLTQSFISLCRDKKLNAYYEDNDILIDGYKVCAFSNNLSPENNWGFSTITFTLNIDLNLIQNICNKPMVKVPKGLSEFGITQEDILSLLEDMK